MISQDHNLSISTFAMLTTEPGPDIAPYHDRQIVVLPPGASIHWLDLSASEALILTPSALGQLNVTRIWPE